MNRDVEERIVAMYFNNEDFEKNAKTTLDTLGQLRKGLDLEDAAKGFGIFEKIGKVLDFEKASKNVTKIKSTLGSMGNIFKKVFNLGPLDEAARAVNRFKTNYLDRVIGFDLAHKVADSLETTFRALTIQPIGAGWDQYQSKMDSVKTIMSSTGESIEVVETHLQNMTEYANKTIYSLVDMTSNLGKFTNNGVKLQDAVTAMEGIANAAADAGQGSQQASMAMYNISQAIGVGKMTSIDWKSIENANMATSKLKNTFLEIAAAGGKLRKEVKEVNGQMQTTFWLDTDENGKKLKNAIALTAENFREYLSKGWLDKETMIRALQIYSGQEIDVDTLEAWGIKDKALQQSLLEIGQDALEAATQVRTFSKMMDALKESVQSGWARSFEIIFGNMEEGTQLWTKMNERFDAILTASSNRRNEVLKGWAEMTEGEQAYWKKDEQGNTIRTGVKGGRDILIDTFFELFDVIQQFSKMVSQAFSNVFGKVDSKTLFQLTTGFRDLVDRIKEWFGSLSGSNSRITKLQKGLQGIFSVIKSGLNIFKMVFNLAKKVAGPVVDFLIDKFAKIGEFFNGIGDLKPVEMIQKIGEGIKNVWEKVKRFFTPQDILDKSGKSTGQQKIPAVEWLENLWTGLKTTVKQWAEENGLGDVWANVTSWWNNIKNAIAEGKTSLENTWNTVKNWFIESGISGFFTNTWAWITSQFTSSGNIVSGYRNGRLESWYEEAPVVTWLSDIWEKVKTFWNDTILGTAVPIWESIASFAGNTWGWIVSQFSSSGNIVSGYRNGRLESWYEEAPVVSWLSGIWESISSFWNNTILGIATPVWEAIASFASNTWSWIKDQFNVVAEDGTERTEPPIVTWLSGIWESVESFWNNTILGIATPVWESIAQFAGNIWGWISSQFSTSGNIISGYRNGRLESWYEEAPIVTWLRDIWEGIKDTWNNIVGWSGWSAIGTFLSNTWGWITGLFSGSSGSVAGASKASVEAAKENTMTPEETEESLNFFQKIMVTIGDFIKKVTDAIDGVVIPEGVRTFFDNFSLFIEGILNVASHMFGLFGRITTGKANLGDYAETFGIILAAIGGLIIKMKMAKWTSGLGNVQSFSTSFLSFAGALALIAGAVSLLTTVDPTKLGQAFAIVEVVALTIGGFVTAISAINSGHEEPKISGVERFFTNLINKVSMLGMVFILMKELPPIINSISAAKQAGGGKDIGDDLLKVAESIAIMFTSITVVMTIIGKLGGSGGIDPKATALTMLSVVEVFTIISLLMLAVGGIGEAADGIFGKYSHEAIIRAMNKASEFMMSLGNAIGGFFMGLFGIKSDLAKTQEALSIADLLAEASESFSSEKISGLSRMMTLIAKLSDNTVKIDTNKMSRFGEAMGEIGNGIYTVATYIAEVEGPLSELHNPDSVMNEKLKAFIGFGTNLAAMLEPIGSDFFRMDKVLNSLSALAEDNNLKAFVDNINKILTGLSGINNPSEGIQFDGLSIVQKLFNAVQDGLDQSVPTFDATCIVDAIVLALTNGDLAIAQTVHEMVQNGINLGSGLTDKSGWQLPSYLIPKELGGTGGVNGWGIGSAGKIGSIDLLSQLDFGSLEESAASYQKTFDELSQSFDGFATKLPDISSMMDEKGWTEFLSMKDEDGNDVDILGTMQSKIAELNEALNNTEVTITITPVFNYERFTPEAIQEELNKHLFKVTTTTETPVVQLDYVGLAQALEIAGIKSKLDSIVSAIINYGASGINSINSLASHIDGIAAEVSNMKVIFDTGAFVGYIAPYIDQELYRRGFYTSRTGTVK